MQRSGQLHRIGAALTLLTLVACSKAAESVSEPAPPAATPAATPAAPEKTIAPPPPIVNPTDIGSQDAKDDLYCSGLIISAYPQPEDAVVPVEQARLDKFQALAVMLGFEGTGKLMKQGVALAPQTGAVADAWADIAYKDFIAKKPKITLDACLTRAEKVAADSGQPLLRPTP